MFCFTSQIQTCQNRSPYHETGITFFDAFAGLGGASKGVENAGIKLSYAMNHNPKSLATHAYNFPYADHDCIDITQANPLQFGRVSIAWFSPECTFNSTSKGVKLVNQLLDELQPNLPGMENELGWTDLEHLEFKQRSRATMKEVYRWAAAFCGINAPIQAILVENVPQVEYWAGLSKWLKEMEKLGYVHQSICFNSQFAPTGNKSPVVPQYRERWYTIFTRVGNPRPNLDIHPLGMCQRCEKEVGCQQRWKQPGRKRQFGLYGKQYDYVCPHCLTRVIPYFTPASSIIQWDLKAQRIGDRKTALKPKTIKRIEKGIERFCTHSSNLPPFAVEVCRTHAIGGHVRSLVEPLFTQTQAQSVGIVLPPPSQKNQPFLASYYGGSDCYKSVLTDTVGTCTSRDRHALIIPPSLSNQKPTVDECFFRMLHAIEVKLAMGIPKNYTVIATSQKEIVRQAGLAVTPAVAEMLARFVLQSLGYSIDPPKWVSRYC